MSKKSSKNIKQSFKLPLKINPITTIQKLAKKFSYLLLIGLFMISMVVTPVVAKSLGESNSLVENQNTSLEINSESNDNFCGDSNVDKTITEWQNKVQDFRDSGNKLNQAIALSNLSVIYQKNCDWNNAQNSINQSLNILQNLEKTNEQQQILAQTYDIKGHLEQQIGQSLKAIETWEKAANIYSEIEDENSPSGLFTNNLINQTQALQDLGLNNRSCDVLANSFGFGEQCFCLVNAFTGDNPNQTNNPLENQQSRQQCNPEIKGFADVNSLIQNLQGYSSFPDEAVFNRALYSAGNVLQSLFYLDESQWALEASLVVAKNRESLVDESKTLLSLGNTLFENKQPDMALEYYEKAEETANKAQLSLLKLQAKINQFNVYALQKKWEKSKELDAITNDLNNSNLPLNRSSIYTKINLAKNIYCLETRESNCLKQGEANNNSPNYKPIWLVENNSPVVDLLSQAINEAEILEDKHTESYARGLLGRFYEDYSPQNLDEAIKFTKEALTISRNIEANDLNYQWYWQLGRLLLIDNEINDKPEQELKAFSYYRQAYNILQTLRSELSTLSKDVQFNFRDEVESLYRKYVALLLKNPTDDSSYLVAARNTIETLQLAELDNFFREACIRLNPETIDKIIKKAVEDDGNPTTAVVYTIVLDDRIGVILNIPEQPLQIHETMILKEDVFSLINGAEDNQDDGLVNYLNNQTRLASDITKYSSSIYDWLIKPFEDSLTKNKIENLVFVLDDPLRNVPMSVLYNEKSGKYLVEEYSIAITPGLRILESQPLAKFKSNNNNFGAGLTEEKIIEGTRFDALDDDNVRKELKAIPNMEKPLLNESFKKEKFTDQVEDNSYNIVHLATHGVFSSVLDQTFVLTWDGVIKAPELDGLLQNKEVNSSTPIELLVLSACETASGDKRATLGLAGIAVRAGARSTLATLWQVNDGTTSNIMVKFYDEIKNNSKINRAKALQDAQRKFLQEARERKNNLNPRHLNPYYWSPFVLVGNWL